jgi:hypothetical protein
MIVEKCTKFEGRATGLGRRPLETSVPTSQLKTIKYNGTYWAAAAAPTSGGRWKALRWDTLLTSLHGTAVTATTLTFPASAATAEGLGS